MTVLGQLLAAAALVATAVIYGTNVFAAIMLRPALAHVDDRTLTATAGYKHDHADRHLPVPGAIGLAAAVLGTAVAALAGHPGAAVAGGAAALAMAVWLLIYRRISAPINRQLTAAAHDGRIPGDARALQRRWDSVINSRAALQTGAVAAGGRPSSRSPAASTSTRPTWSPNSSRCSRAAARPPATTSARICEPTPSPC